MSSDQQQQKTNNIITFKTNDISASDFVSAHIFRSIDYLCGGFVLQTSDFKKTKGLQNLKQGSACTISIDDVVVITGYIDSINIIYTKEEHMFIISGRDKTSILVDSSNAAADMEWKNIALSSVLTNLCAPFSITVVFDATASSSQSTIIEKFVANEGETVYKLISDLLLDFGLLPISKGDGKLTITKATTTEKASDTIDTNINVSTIDYLSDNTDRFKTYNVKGIGIGSDAKSQLVDFIQPGSTVIDNRILTEKTLTIFCENPTTLDQTQKRVAWEACTRAGNSRVLKYTLGGLVQKNNSKPWQFNTLVDVKDSVLNITTTMLIRDVEFFQNDTGPHVNVSLVDKNTYSGNMPTMEYPYD